MSGKKSFFIFLAGLLPAVLLPLAAWSNEPEMLHYRITVTLAPEHHRLTAQTTITVPPGYPRRFSLALHRGLEPEAADPAVTISPGGRMDGGGGRVGTFTVTLPPEVNTFTLNYGGEIYHPLGFAGRDYARGVRYTPGRIDPEGAYLGPAAFWYPRLLGEEHFLSFHLQVRLPAGWTAVSQGRLLETPPEAAAADGQTVRRLLGAAKTAPVNEMIWEESKPQEGIFLIADRFTVYQEQTMLPEPPANPGQASSDRLAPPVGRPEKTTTSAKLGGIDGSGKSGETEELGRVEAPGGNDRGRAITAMVFLRQSDPELARRYLDATAHYLAKYSALLGPYPYAKFALVENGWESGFGMPSFTLLGSRVIRLPFILHSSYPHEILHNWWGNGVFTDYAAGNWNEGLTAYLADHLLLAEQGRGAEYRRGVLQKYADYAAGGRDFPLLRFTARHDPAGEAVGYGKSLMFFHMLRQKLGDEIFFAGLRHFYQANLFRRASFADLEKSFAAAGNLGDFFAQWLEREGAPELALEQSAVRAEQDGTWRLEATFSQSQPGPPYHLLLPVAVTLAGEEEPRRFLVELNDQRGQWKASFSRKPRRLELDPDFDLFRLLDRREIPPAFSSLYGREDPLLVVLPSREESPALVKAYRELALALPRFGAAGVELVGDDELTALPPGRGIILLGRHNRFQAQAAEALPRLNAALKPDGSLQIATADKTDHEVQSEVQFEVSGHAFALALPHPGEPGTVLGWIVMDQPEMLPHLIRRLPHYHRYGALIFHGPTAENILRHHWPAPDSPLQLQLGM